MNPILGALLGTLLVLAFNVLIASALTGVGLALRRTFGLKQATLEDCFLAPWMGFSVVLLFLILWNFVLPIGPAAFVIVVALGCAGLFASRRTLWTACRSSDVPLWSVIAVLLFGLWIANLSLKQSVSWDTALYHMQGVRWAIDYPAPPGLANLFGPLGFNNSNLLYGAMLNVGPFSGRSWHVANGALLWLFASHSITSIGVLHRTTATKAPQAVFASLLLPFAVSALVRGNVSSYSTVVPAGLVALVVAALAFRVCCDNRRSGHERAYDYVCIAALAAVSVSIKASNAVFAATTLILTCGALFRGDVELARWRTRALTWTIVGVASIGVAWAARGVVLSGYPLFPSSFLNMPVDWRVPAEHARAELAFVMHSARATTGNFAYVSGEVEGLRAWFPRWLTFASSQPFMIAVPLAFTFLASAVVIATARSASRSARLTMRRAWWMLGPIAGTLIVWFVVAPMPHYGEAFFWALTALVTSQAVRLAALNQSWSRRLGWAALAFGLTPCVVTPFLWGTDNPLLTILKANVALPERGHWLQPTPALPAATQFTTDSGLVLSVPSGSGAPRCWFTPVPCTPNPAPNLQLRQPNRMEHGFTVDDSWQMHDWPEPWRPELLPALRRSWDRSAAATPAN